MPIIASILPRGAPLHEFIASGELPVAVPVPVAVPLIVVQISPALVLSPATAAQDEVKDAFRGRRYVRHRCKL